MTKHRWWPRKLPIQMRIQTWNRDLMDDQQEGDRPVQVRGSAATGWAEHDTPDFAIKGAAGIAVIPRNGTP